MCYQGDTLALVRGERLMAVAVIARAMADATCRDPILFNRFTRASWSDVEEAREFISEGNESLEAWCEIIGVDPEFVVRATHAAIKSGTELSYDKIMESEILTESGA